MSETTNLHLKKHDNVTTNENPFDIENYLNDNWDKIDTGYGTILTDYVKNTDYATNSKGGVAKVQPTVYGLRLDGNGFLSVATLNYNQYSSINEYYCINKGTLENVITGKNLETANNKVTSISSSSTDTQYPSAKCVYDLVGDIESILEELDIGGGVV